MHAYRRLLSIALLGLALTACENPIGSSDLGAAQAGDPAIGTKTDAKSLLDFYPQFLAGMHYAYVSVEQKGAVEKSTRVEAEVLSSDADKAKLRITIAGSASNTIDVNRAAPPVLPPGGIVFEGREQVNVPAGSFNAQKFSYSQNTSSFNAWAEREVGILKILEQRVNGDTVTTELQSYRR